MGCNSVWRVLFLFIIRKAGDKKAVPKWDSLFYLYGSLTGQPWQP